MLISYIMIAFFFFVFIAFETIDIDMLVDRIETIQIIVVRIKLHNITTLNSPHGVSQFIYRYVMCSGNI